MPSLSSHMHGLNLMLAPWIPEQWNADSDYRTCMVESSGNNSLPDSSSLLNWKDWLLSLKALSAIGTLNSSPTKDGPKLQSPVILCMVSFCPPFHFCPVSFCPASFSLCEVWQSSRIFLTLFLCGTYSLSSICLSLSEPDSQIPNLFKAQNTLWPFSKVYCLMGALIISIYATTTSSVIVVIKLKAII